MNTHANQEKKLQLEPTHDPVAFDSAECHQHMARHLRSAAKLCIAWPAQPPSATQADHHNLRRQRRVASARAVAQQVLPRAARLSAPLRRFWAGQACGLGRTTSGGQSRGRGSDHRARKCTVRSLLNNAHMQPRSTCCSRRRTQLFWASARRGTRRDETSACTQWRMGLSLEARTL